MSLNRILAAAVSVAFLAQVSAAEAKNYYSSPPEHVMGFVVTDKCYSSKEKAEKGVGLNAAVLQYALAQKPSFVHSHFAALAAWHAGGGGKTSSNAGIMDLIQADYAHISGAQKDFVSEHSAATLDGLAKATDPGVIMARAVAKQTADAAQMSLAKKGCAGYMWGWRWDKSSGEWKTPTEAGGVWTSVYAFPSKGEVHVHIWSPKGFNTNSTKPVAIYDVSAVEGAFDASADLSWETVSDKIQSKTPGLEIVYDDEVGFIVEAKK